MVGDVKDILDHSSTFPYTPTTMETPTQPSSTTYVRSPAQMAEGIRGNRHEDLSLRSRIGVKLLRFWWRKSSPAILPRQTGTTTSTWPSSVTKELEFVQVVLC